MYIGPVTTLGALFIENLEPKLQSVKATGTKAGSQGDGSALGPPRGHQARLKLRREGADEGSSPTAAFPSQRA